MYSRNEWSTFKYLGLFHTGVVLILPLDRKIKPCWEIGSVVKTGMRF